MKEPSTTLAVVMAEDDPDDRLPIREAFEATGHGYALRFVPDGDTLLDSLLRQGPYRDAGPPPALIPLDLNMPRMDGREAVARIRRNPRLRRLPVVAPGTSQAALDNERCLGVCGYLTKPGRFENLVGRVRALENLFVFMKP